MTAAPTPSPTSDDARPVGRTGPVAAPANRGAALTDDGLAAKVAAARAILFDLDGVLLSTVELHRQAWGDIFTAWFQARGLEPPDMAADYHNHLDGRPRYDGVRAVLKAHGLDLPWGGPADEPGSDSVCGLGNAKNQLFLSLLAAGGAVPFPETVGLLLRLLRRGQSLAVVSSSDNARLVLDRAGIADAFTVVVDGRTAQRHGLRGKPAPDGFRHAADRLGVTMARTVVVEDAVAGVAAGRASGSGLVVGVDRGAGRERLLAAGADVVVTSLEALAPRASAADR
ncbi:MAG: HAD-IA family hydrolase [Propionibacteriaceae bacterium]|nr:HAD-IA family hydrolase [Propionibacteriaceae bacterium]